MLGVQQQHGIAATGQSCAPTLLGLLQGVQEMRQADEVMADYECPICLSLLHAPVVLSCAHRFCWGCLLAYCATQAQPPSASGEPQLCPISPCPGLAAVCCTELTPVMIP